MRLISFVIPAYNERENIGLIAEKITHVMHPLREKYEFEILLIDDGSIDTTWYEIEKLCDQDVTHIRGVHFSRNF